MNGKIVVQSKFGEGSKFSVSLDQRIVKDKKELELSDMVSDILFADRDAIDEYVSDKILDSKKD